MPYKAAILDALKDKEWHDYGDILEEVGQLVDPDVAYSKAEYYRAYHYKRSGKNLQDRVHGAKEDTVKTGQRLVVSKCIQTLRRNQKVEVEFDDANPKRRRPVRIKLGNA